MSLKMIPAHPKDELRWLRNGTLAVIVVAGLLCGLVTENAHREIATATGEGTSAITDINAANKALAASDPVGSSLTGSELIGTAAIGPGSNYSDDFTAASNGLVSAAAHNVAGGQGAELIQFDEGLLLIYNSQVQQAITDFTDDRTLAHVELGYANTVEKEIDLTPTPHVTNSLRQTEQMAVTAELDSRWLGPGDIWWLLLAPFFVLLLLAARTSYVLWHGFRRLLSGRLTVAVVAMLGLIVLVASLNVHDGGQAKAFVAATAGSTQAPGATDVSFAVSPLALAAWPVLIIAALALGYAAYGSRLDEYRYRP
jgi:hypothetical protein